MRTLHSSQAEGTRCEQPRCVCWGGAHSCSADCAHAPVRKGTEMHGMAISWLGQHLGTLPALAWMLSSCGTVGSQPSN